MNDKKLADKVVALGVGGMFGDGAYFSFENSIANDDQWVIAELFVRDWRVAGALMEKVDKFCAGTCKECILVSVNNNETMEFETESLPRAITEACVEALSDE